MKLTTFALTVVLLAGGVARAECPAKTYYDQATAAYGLGRFAEAATAFEKAYECKPQAALLWDAAQAHREAGNRRRAIELLQNYLHVFGAQAENGADVKHLIAELQAEEAKAAGTPGATATPGASGPGAPATATAPATTTAPRPATGENALVAAAPPPRKPIYKRAWFWGAVAGGAVVLGVVIGVSAAYGIRTKDPTPSIGTWAF